MKFEFSGSLYRFANYNREVVVDGNTVGECLDRLVEKFPSLATTMLDSTGGISGSHNLFINGEPVARGEMQDLRAKPMKATDVVYVLTAVTGG